VDQPLRIPKKFMLHNINGHLDGYGKIISRADSAHDICKPIGWLYIDVAALPMRVIAAISR